MRKIKADRVLFVLGVVALGAAVAVYFRDGDRTAAPANSPALVVGITELDMPSVAPGEREISIPISNPSRETRRIIGLAPS
jgi:hypothetical protein